MDLKRKLKISIIVLILVVICVVTCLCLLFLRNQDSFVFLETSQTRYEMGAQEALSADDWVLGMFDDLAIWMEQDEFGRPFSRTVDESDWDFEVSIPSSESRHYALSEEYESYVRKTGNDNPVWLIPQAANAYVGDLGGVPFEETSVGTDAAFTLRDSDGNEVHYSQTDALREFAEAVYADAAEKWKDNEFPARGISSGGEVDGETTVIAPDGTKINRGVVSVYFTNGTSNERIKAIGDELGLLLEARWPEAKSGEHKGHSLVYFCTPTGLAEWDVRDSLSRYPEVVEAELVEYKEPEENEAVFFGDTSPVLSSTQPSLPWDHMLQYYLRLSGFDDAWKTITCDGKITVGVIDGGIDYRNSELKANVDTAHMANVSAVAGGGKAVIGTKADMNDLSVSEKGATIKHGTPVSGIISAVAGDSAGVDGASHNAVILPVKDTNAEGKSKYSDMIASYKYLLGLDDCPDVINISSGFSFASMEVVNSRAWVKELQSRINKAWNKGIVTVAAAGNDGDEVNSYYVPACLDHVVSVGALKQPGVIGDFLGAAPELWSRSNTRSNVDICAYGEAILSVAAYPDDDGHNAHTSGDGTSYAAPQVSSAIALVKAKHPNWSAKKLVNAVLKTAKPMKDSNGEKIAGTGAGALDAAASVGYGSTSGSSSPSTGGSAYELALQGLSVSE